MGTGSAFQSGNLAIVSMHVRPWVDIFGREQARASAFVHARALANIQKMNCFDEQIEAFLCLTRLAPLGSLGVLLYEFLICSLFFQIFCDFL